MLIGKMKKVKRTSALNIILPTPLTYYHHFRYHCVVLGSEGEEIRLHKGTTEGRCCSKPKTEEGRCHSAPHQRLLQGRQASYNSSFASIWGRCRCTVSKFDIRKIEVIIKFSEEMMAVSHQFLEQSYQEMRQLLNSSFAMGPDWI